MSITFPSELPSAYMMKDAEEDSEELFHNPDLLKKELFETDVSFEEALVLYELLVKSCCRDPFKHGDGYQVAAGSVGPQHDGKITGFQFTRRYAAKAPLTESFSVFERPNKLPAAIHQNGDRFRYPKGAKCAYEWCAIERVVERQSGTPSE